MAAWKAFERRCAHALGGRRRPVMGLDVAMVTSTRRCLKCRSSYGTVSPNT
jgi:hypothetical protein